MLFKCGGLWFTFFLKGFGNHIRRGVALVKFNLFVFFVCFAACDCLYKVM